MVQKPLIVVKIGGSIANTPAELAQDIAALSSQYSFVVVHGGASQTSALSERLGIKPQFITSPSGVKSRYTDAQAIEIYTLAMRGQVNAKLVLALQSQGIKAIGLSGIDGKLLQARQKIVTAVSEDGKQKIVRDDFTGKIESVNSSLLRSLIEAGYTPIIAPLALGESNQPLNTDGDRSAAAVASALKASKLLLMTDVEGYFENFPNNLVGRMPRAQVSAATQNASGGMKRKLLASGEALDGGVGEVVIGNGTQPKPISSAIGGSGTHITNSG